MPGKKGPDNDDMLVVLRADGNVIIDHNVRQEHGLLISDKWGWTMPRVDQVSVVEWIRPEASPVADKAAFVVSQEPPPPTMDSRLINETCPAVYTEAKEGQSWRQKYRRRREAWMKGVLVMTAAAAFAFSFIVMPLIIRPQAPGTASTNTGCRCGRSRPTLSLSNGGT